MSRHSRKATKATEPPAPAIRTGPWGRLWPFAVLLVATILFYWTPLTSASASIQWDAADVHYSSQKYFADSVRAGHLPFWTPYIFSGFPFLADPQVGAWYPPNWPFFLVGITPQAVECELTLHALLAAIGAYLLGLRLLKCRSAALAGAMLFAFSGFFAGHSSHVGMFQGAACFPWLLAGLFGAIETRRRRYIALAAIAGGCMGLAGHFQTALYGFAAFAVVAAVSVARRRAEWLRTAVVVAAVVGLAALIAAIAILPGLELTANSTRASMNTATSTEGILDPRALVTLIYPDFLGAISGKYVGPGDVTQYYFYAGLLLLPLAFLGLKRRGERIVPAALALAAIWYACGPWLGLYRLAGLLPGFHNVRAPIHVWFVAALGLSLLAAAGMKTLVERWPRPALIASVLALTFCDLFYWNSAQNPLAYARTSFEDIYGPAEQGLGRVAATQPPLTRFWAPDKLPALGPMNGPLDVRLEATYGYNPLELRAYAQYRQTAASNPPLVGGLNVSRRLNMESGEVEETPSQQRAYFPRQILYARSERESQLLLPRIHPPDVATVLAGPFGISQDAAASATFVAIEKQACQIRYRSSSRALLRVAIPFYPGWRAAVDGADARIVRVDHALLGVVVPAGAHELRLWFHPSLFEPAAGLSLAGLAAALGLLVPFGRARTRGARDRPAPGQQPSAKLLNCYSG